MIEDNIEGHIKKAPLKLMMTPVRPQHFIALLKRETAADDGDVCVGDNTCQVEKFYTNKNACITTDGNLRALKCCDQHYTFGITKTCRKQQTIGEMVLDAAAYLFRFWLAVTRLCRVTCVDLSLPNASHSYIIHHYHPSRNDKAKILQISAMSSE